MQTARQAQPKLPPPPRMTKWRNPTKLTQRFQIVENGQRYTVEIGAGESADLSSVHDDHIQRVQCNDDECRAKPYRFCLKGHAGVVVGGVAPMLERVGVELVLGKGLDPAEAEKAAAQAELARKALAKKQIEDEMAIAAAKAADVKVDEAKPAAADKPPPKKLPPSLA